MFLRWLLSGSPMFIATTSAPQRNWVTKQFIRQRKAAGIDHFRLHDLRHFMATQMLGAGVAVPVVSLAWLMPGRRRR